MNKFFSIANILQPEERICIEGKRGVMPNISNPDAEHSKVSHKEGGSLSLLTAFATSVTSSSESRRIKRREKLYTALTG